MNSKQMQCCDHISDLTDWRHGSNQRNYREQIWSPVFVANAPRKN